MRGGVEWQIQHKAKPSAVFAQDPLPEYCIFPYITINSALTDLLFCIGRISNSSSDGFKWMCISK